MSAAGQIQVDCRGMCCPAPILEIAKAARGVGGNHTTLQVTATDGDFPTDLRAWCRSTGANLRELRSEAGTFVATVELNKPTPKHQDAPELLLASPAEQAESLAVDCVGMTCPAPILAVAKAVRGRGPTLLEVRADDADFPIDIRSWARTARAEILGIDSHNGVFTARIATGGAKSPAAAQGAQSAPVEAAPAPQAAQAAPASTGPLDLRKLRTPQVLLRVGGEVLDAGDGPVHFLAPAALDRQSIDAWAEMSGVEVMSHGRCKGGWAVILRNTPTEYEEDETQGLDGQGVPRRNHTTLLVLRNDFESLMAAMMVANSSAAQGMTVDIYFSFWGVNLLRGERPRPVQSTEIARTGFLQGMMKWMMPKGPDRQTMSKMHMGGVGLGMMKFFMRKQNVMTLRELMDQAVELEVTFKVCTMSMGIMGIQKQDLMDLPNLEFGGVTAFTADARTSACSMVF